MPGCGERLVGEAALPLAGDIKLLIRDAEEKIWDFVAQSRMKVGAPWSENGHQCRGLPGGPGSATGCWSGWLCTTFKLSAEHEEVTARGSSQGLWTLLAKLAPFWFDLGDTPSTEYPWLL